MNTVFRVVFNAATRTFTAASEAAKCKKTAGSILTGLVFVAASGFAHAGADSLISKEESSNGSTSNHMQQLADVANGTHAHDAVNLEQLDGKVNESDFVEDQHRQDRITESNRKTQDARSNELSDRAYKAQKTADIGIKYDNSEVVKTDEDLKDTISGVVMHDRNDKALKVRTTKRGDDKVTFRGDKGTTLENVADGTVASDSKQAVNGSQLKAVSDVANNSVQYDAPGETSGNGLSSKTENGPVVTLKQGLNEGDDTGTTIRNVRDGKVDVGSREAVNGGQLAEQSDRIDVVNSKTNDNADGIESLKTTKADQSALDATNGNVAQLQRDQKATDIKLDSQGADIKRNGDAIKTKADADKVEAALNTKADKSETDKLWADKASKSDVNEVRAAGVKESEERIKNDKAAQDKINDLYANKADKRDVNEVRAAAAKESDERTKNDKAINDRVDTTNANLDKESAARAAADANQQAQIDTKADAREVNEWLETKADQSDLNQTNVNVAGNTAAIANESGRAQKAEAANADAAKTAQTSADAANAGVVTNGTAIAKETVERQNDVSRLDGQKLDKDVFAKDQRRQDAALDRETQNRTNDVNDARQKASGAQKTADTAQSGVDHLSATKADATDLKVETRERKAETANLEARKADKAEVAAEAKARQNGESKLDAKKADRSEVKAVADRGEATRAKVDGVANHQVKQDAAITNAQSTADAGLTVGNAAYTQSRMNTEDIQTLNNAVNAETGRAQKAEAGLQRGIDKNASDIAGLKGDINSVRNEERAGIAAAVAGANIPQAIHAGKGNIGAGFGSFHGSNAVAVGGSYRFSNDSTTIKATVGVGSGSNMTFGAGISQEF